MIAFQVLQQVGGDVDAANEFLIAEQATEDYLAESDELSRPTDTSHGNGQLVHISLSRHFFGALQLEWCCLFHCSLLVGHFEFSLA